MADFLSEAWMHELEAVAPSVDPAVDFALEQIIPDAPGGELRYVVHLRAGRVRIVPGPADPPADVTLRTSYAASVDLATGRTTVHDAILGGTIRVAGDLDRLQEATPTLAAVAVAFGA